MSELKLGEKKEVKNMKKLGMSNVDKDTLLELVVGNELALVIPKTVVVRDIDSGSIDRKDKEPLLWATLKVSDSEELKALTDLGYEENVSIIKLKIVQYGGESLDYMIGKTVDTSDLEIVFDEKNTPRGTTLRGLAFRSKLQEIKVVG